MDDLSRWNLKTVLFAHQKQGKDKWSIKQEEKGMQMIYNVTADFFLMESPERNILNTYQITVIETTTTFYQIFLCQKAVRNWDNVMALF